MPFRCAVPALEHAVDVSRDGVSHHVDTCPCPCPLTVDCSNQSACAAPMPKSASSMPQKTSPGRRPQAYMSAVVSHERFPPRLRDSDVLLFGGGSSTSPVPNESEAPLWKEASGDHGPRDGPAAGASAGGWPEPEYWCTPCGRLGPCCSGEPGMRLEGEAGMRLKIGLGPEEGVALASKREAPSRAPPSTTCKFHQMLEKMQSLVSLYCNRKKTHQPQRLHCASTKPTS